MRFYFLLSFRSSLQEYFQNYILKHILALSVHKLISLLYIKKTPAYHVIIE